MPPFLLTVLHVRKDESYIAVHGCNSAIFHPRTIRENGRPTRLKTFAARRPRKNN
jgi:hypothetical protein